MLKLFSIHDDPRGHERDFPENVFWLAIWATSGAVAADIYLDKYAGGGEPRAPRDIKIARIDTPEHAPAVPGVERQAEVLRLIGWSYEGERYCECCGLAAVGLEQYEVCDGCDTCPDCGCGCDESDAARPSAGCGVGNP